MANLRCYGPSVLLVLGQLVRVASAEVLSSHDGRFSIEVPKISEPQYQWTDRRTNRSWIVGYREQQGQRNVSPPFLKSSTTSSYKASLTAQKASSYDRAIS